MVMFVFSAVSWFTACDERCGVYVWHVCCMKTCEAKSYWVWGEIVASRHADQQTGASTSSSTFAVRDGSRGSAPGGRQSRRCRRSSTSLRRVTAPRGTYYSSVGRIILQRQVRAGTTTARRARWWHQPNRPAGNAVWQTCRSWSSASDCHLARFTTYDTSAEIIC